MKDSDVKAQEEDSHPRAGRGGWNGTFPHV